MRQLRHGQRTDDGFTLVELLVVIGLLAVAAMVAVPLANAGRHGHELRAAAIALASDMKSARATASRTNVEQTVEIDTGRGLRNGITLELTTIRSEQSGLATGRVRFYPDGSATGGRVLLRSGPRTASVTIDWLTGGTRVDWQN